MQIPVEMLCQAYAALGFRQTGDDPLEFVHPDGNAMFHYAYNGVVDMALLVENLEVCFPGMVTPMVEILARLMVEESRRP